MFAMAVGVCPDAFTGRSPNRGAMPEAGQGPQAIHGSPDRVEYGYGTARPTIASASAKRWPRQNRFIKAAHMRNYMCLAHRIQCDESAMDGFTHPAPASPQAFRLHAATAGRQSGMEETR